jgi:hypothetical protein
MRSIFVVLLLASTAAPAANITLDFEEYSGSVSTFDPLPVVESQGFRLTPQGPAVWVVDEFGIPSDIFIGLSSGGSLTIATESGQTFNLESFDYALYAGSTSLTISVALASGRADVFTLGDLTGTGSMYTYNSMGLFNNIMSFTVFDSGVLPVVGNIVVSTVPIPAAVWLFGSALACLGWLRRKQAV